MSRVRFVEGWSAEPFWWQEAPRPRPPETPARLPREVDVVIVGAGYTGLAAALELARAGRGVLVLDAGPPGFGASSRNGGMVGHGHRVRYDDLVQRHGAGLADALVREGLHALRHTTTLIEREGISCRFARTGRFRAAWCPAHYDLIARDVEGQAQRFGFEAWVVPRREQHREVASERYHGGCVYPEHGGLHPGLLHQGLLSRAEASGALVIGWNPVEAVQPRAGGFIVRTARGRVLTRNVIVATNGYSRTPSGEPGRQLAPIASFIIATEPLGQERVRSLLPGMRMMVESRAAHGYYRPSPDGERILFGARAALRMISAERAAARNVRYMLGLFPSLENVGVTHSWSGWVAFTPSLLPAIGKRAGIHYAMGYNGSGVAMAPYLGFRIAHKILGDEEGRTAFDHLPFRTWPLTAALPLVRPVLGAWHRLKDWREGS